MLRRPVVRATTVVAALALLLAGAPAALADDPVVPSAGSVAAARRAAAAASQQASALEAQQAGLAARLTTLQLGVARAVDAQQQAEQDLARAVAVADKAAAALDAARSEATRAHRAVTDAAFRAWTNTGEMSQLELALAGSPASMADAQFVLDTQNRRTSDALAHAAEAAAAATSRSAYLDATRADEQAATRRAADARRAAEGAEAAARAQADDLAAQAAALDTRVAALRDRAARLSTERTVGLAARARARARAAAAAAAARRRAEAAAQAAHDQAAQHAGSTPVVGGGGGSPSSAQRTAAAMIGSHGWGAGQMGCLVDLWNGESGWSWSATNPSSGAYGIPQALPSWKMASAGSDWLTNPTTQIRWGLDYIDRAYGSPCSAWSAWQARSPHWY